MSNIKILSLDGGGIRGIISVRIMQHLKIDAKDYDFIAGTSIGSINACFLAAGGTPDELMELYREDAKKIFKKRKGLGSRLGWRSKYDIKNLEKVLKKHFGNKTLGDLQTNVIVPALRLRTHDEETGALMPGPVVFSSARSEYKHNLLYNVCCKSAAAQTYFQSYKGYVDGGNFANNPSTTALCEVLDVTNKTMKDIELTSIGTGLSASNIRGGDWGWMQWAKNLLPLFFAGTEESSEKCVDITLDDRSIKHQIKLSQNYGLDAVGDIDKMIAEVDKAFGA